VRRSRGGLWSAAALLVYSVPLAFLGVFFFYPLAEILKLSLAPQGALDLPALGGLVAGDYYLRVAGFSVYQAALSTVLTLAAALPPAYIFAHYDFPGKAVLRALTTVPFVLPAVVVATAFTALLGPTGWVNQLLRALLGSPRAVLDVDNSLGLILLAHVFYNFAIVLRIVGGFWANLDPQLEQAARVLGAGRARALTAVTLPLLAPALLAAALLVFIFDFTSFGVILILGGPRFTTLEVAIYRETFGLGASSLARAAALALVQIAFTFGLTVAYTRLQARVSRPIELRPQRQTRRPLRGARARLLVAAALAFTIGLLLTPLAALVLRSVAVGTGDDLRLGLDYYRALFAPPLRGVEVVAPLVAMRNSLMFALSSTLLALALGLAAAYTLARPSRWANWLDPIMMLPLGTSAVTLGLGFLVAFDQGPLMLRSSLLLLPIAHALVAFPFVVRSVLPVMRGIRPELREAAAVLGATPRQVWRAIDLPIIGRALLVAAAFAFTVSLGEFGATAMIAWRDWPTLPYAIFRFLRAGALNYGQALALSTLLMVTCAGALLLIERARVGDIGEF
jgi:thiamine transport system permease protein